MSVDFELVYETGKDNCIRLVQVLGYHQLGRVLKKDFYKRNKYYYLF